MSRYYLLLLGIVFLSSCSSANKELEAKRTVIAGVVHNFSDVANVLVVNYCDPLSDEHRFAQSLAESDGCFHVQHEYVFPQNLTIRLANRFVNVFVFPGDSLFVNIDAGKIATNQENAVEFAGRNAELNRELFQWTARSYGHSEFLFDENASPSVFLASVKRNFQAAKDTIEAYSQRTAMSDFMKNWAFTDHKFIAANYFADYRNPETDKWDVLTDAVLNVFDENNFQTMYFQYHLSACIAALIEDDASLGRLLSEKEYAAAVRSMIGKLSEKVPEGTVRDVMLFLFLQEILEDAPELYDICPEIGIAFSSPLFPKILSSRRSAGEYTRLSDAEKRLEEVLYLKEEETELLADVKLLNYLSERHKDKVLYVDVWATWCRPCLEAFTYTPEIHEYFRGKDVAFVNLCLESRTENWLSALKEHNIAGENYFIGGDASTLFYADNNLAGFPSYLIIDKKRNVLNPAPSPKNPETVIRSIETCLK